MSIRSLKIKSLLISILAVYNILVLYVLIVGCKSSEDDFNELPRVHLPFLVMVTTEMKPQYEYLCSGFILSSKWVLSQATEVCKRTNGGLYPSAIKVITVREGQVSQSLSSTDNSVKTVEKVFIHPNYQVSHEEDHNIALLKLKNDLNFDDNLSETVFGLEYANLHKCYQIGFFLWTCKNIKGEKNNTYLSLQYKVKQKNCNTGLYYYTKQKTQHVCTTKGKIKNEGCHAGDGLLCSDLFIGSLVRNSSCKDGMTGPNDDKKHWMTLSSYISFIEQVTGHNLINGRFNASTCTGQGGGSGESGGGGSGGSVGGDSGGFGGGGSGGCGGCDGFSCGGGGGRPGSGSGNGGIDNSGSGCKSDRFPVPQKFNDILLLIALINSGSLHPICNGIVISNKWVLTSASCVCPNGN